MNKQLYNECKLHKVKHMKAITIDTVMFYRGGRRLAGLP